MQNNSLFSEIVDLILAFFSKKGPTPLPNPVEPTATPAPQVSASPEIDWNNPKSKITPHFTVEDACMLHSWNRLANAEDGFTPELKASVIVVLQKMEEVRTLLDCPMNVHCTFRSQKYNSDVVKAIPNDVHAQGLAIDFDCNPKMTIEQVREKLVPELERLNIRMEKNTATWIHLDLRKPGPSGRHFTA